MDGRFLMDDYPNLSYLDTIKTGGYQHYIFSGHTGTSGRPLSLLSFALQYQDWPTNPFAFKLVNVFIHLLNGLLVFCICRLLAISLKLKPGEATTLCLLTTALWLLHPIQSSTVLYVVQRMTQLSAFFMLIGLLGYLSARIYCQNQTTRLSLMAIAVIMGTVLGILSKENAILLPLYILVLEWTLLPPLEKTTCWKLWRMVFLILPLLMLLAYFVVTLEDTINGYHGFREYTATQRLLTQPIILFEYLRTLMLPYPSAFSLFHDDHGFSENLFQPPLTFIAITAWMALIAFAVAVKKGQFNVVAFAILWFISGHLLEASHLNLELYFEHRNYLPSLGIFFLLAWLIVLSWRYLTNKLLSITLISCFYTLVLGITINQMILWGNPIKQAIEWYQLHPQSLRAINNLAETYVSLGQQEQAIKTYHQIEQIYPNGIYPPLIEINLKFCSADNIVPEPLWEDLIHKARHAKRYASAPIVELDSLVLRSRNKQCHLGNDFRLLQLIVTLALNENFTVYRHYLHEIAANLALDMGAVDAALENINAAIQYKPIPQRYVFKIRILLALEWRQQARETIDEFKRFVLKNPRYWLANQEIIRQFEAQWLKLQQEI